MPSGRTSAARNSFCDAAAAKIARARAALQEPAQPLGDMVGGGRAERPPIGQDDHPEPVAHELVHACSGMNTTKKT